MAATGCIALGAWAGAATLGSMADARDAWGTTVPVAVADVALAPGDHAGDATLSLRGWPATLVPPGALREIPDAVIRQHVGIGEPLSAADVGPRPGAAGLLPPGWVAVAVPLDVARRPPLQTGDRVGVVVAGERSTDGAVIDASASLVIVAVAASDAGRVATAALDGNLALTLEPPG